MTDAGTHDLERKLSELTEWRDDAPEVWRDALDARKRAGQARPLLLRLLEIPIPRLLAAAIAIVVIGSLATAILVPRQSDRFMGGVGLSSAPASTSAKRSVANDPQFENPASYGAVDAMAFGGAGGGGRSRGSPGAGMMAGGGGSSRRSPGAGMAGGSTMSSPPSPGASATRHVVQKASMDLVAEDVRAAFMKASMLISEARGEFIEESSLTGEGDGARATMKLRVGASRLHEVLNELRQLGVVTEESLRGDDVTSRVVDLDARIRNERRIEEELLELLNSRTDAPLADVLEVRRELHGVRLEIEQLQAQQDQLSQLTSLAQVLVIITADGDPAPEIVAESIFGHLGESVARAWNDGLHALVDTLSALIRILVGGLVWWVIVLAALLAARWLARRAAARSGA